MPPRDLYQPGSEYHAARRRYGPAAARCLALAIEQLGQPASLLDVGCGEGALVASGRAAGIDAWGVDLAVPALPTEGLLRWDLRQPLDCQRRFEWVLCWEVAEHLPETSAETLVDSLVRHIDRSHGRLLFTAARPGQRGPGHIHCRPAEYWRHLFTDRGLTWMARESAALACTWRAGVPEARWYADNAQVLAWA